MTGDRASHSKAPTVPLSFMPRPSLSSGVLSLLAFSIGNLVGRWIGGKVVSVLSTPESNPLRAGGSSSHLGGTDSRTWSKIGSNSSGCHIEKRSECGGICTSCGTSTGGPASTKTSDSTKSSNEVGILIGTDPDATQLDEEGDQWVDPSLRLISGTAPSCRTDALYGHEGETGTVTERCGEADGTTEHTGSPTNFHSALYPRASWFSITATILRASFHYISTLARAMTTTWTCPIEDAPLDSTRPAALPGTRMTRAIPTSTAPISADAALVERLNGAPGMNASGVRERSTGTVPDAECKHLFVTEYEIDGFYARSTSTCVKCKIKQRPI